MRFFLFGACVWGCVLNCWGCCWLRWFVCVVAFVLFVLLFGVCSLLLVVGMVCCLETAKAPQNSVGCCWWCGLFVVCLFVCVAFCVCFAWGLCLGLFSLVFGVSLCALFFVSCLFELWCLSCVCCRCLFGCCWLLFVWFVAPKQRKHH